MLADAAPQTLGVAACLVAAYRRQEIKQFEVIADPRRTACHRGFSTRAKSILPDA
jgi:hypothetical protein